MKKKCNPIKIMYMDVVKQIPEMAFGFFCALTFLSFIIGSWHIVYRVDNPEFTNTFTFCCALYFGGWILFGIYWFFRNWYKDAQKRCK